MSERPANEDFSYPVPKDIMGRQSVDYAFYYLRSKQSSQDDPSSATDKIDKKTAEARARLGAAAQIVEEWIDRILAGEKIPPPLLPDNIGVADQIIAPPGDNALRLRHSTDTGEFERTEIPRNALLADLLARHGWHYQLKGNTTKQISEADVFREASYFAYLLPAQGKIILVCDRVGNPTRVIHGVENVLETWPEYTSLNESALQAFAPGRVDIVPWPGDGAIWQKLLEVRIAADSTEKQKWFSRRDIALRLGTDRRILGETVERFLAAAPEYQAGEITFTRKMGTVDRTFKQYRGDFVDALEEFFKKETDIPKDWKNFNDLAADLFDELGGETAIGLTEEESKKQLLGFLRNVFYKLYGTKPQPEEARLLVGQWFLAPGIQAQIKNTVLTTKIESLSKPLKPESFKAQPLADIATEIRQAENLSVEEYDELNRYVFNYFKNDLLAGLEPYNLATGQGDYGKFRKKPLDSAALFVSAIVFDQIKTEFINRIRRNRALPAVSADEKRLRTIVEDYVVENRLSIPVNSLYYSVATYLKRDDEIAKQFKPDGDTIKETVANLFSPKLQLYIFYGLQKQAELKTLLADLLAKIEAVPVAEAGDQSLNNLSNEIVSDLKNQGIRRHANNVRLLIEKIYNSLKTNDQDLAGCGKKRRQADSLDVAFYLSQEVAKNIRRIIMAQYI